MPNIVLKDRSGVDQTYSNVQQVVIKDEYGNDVYYSLGGGSVVKVTVLTLTHYEDSHSEALATITNPSHGDIAIIKAPIEEGENTHYEYTSYVFNAPDTNPGVWQAMDGNYSAENVYFDENIQATTTVGYLSGNVQTKGKSVKQVFTEMLQHVVQPTISRYPQVTLSFVGNTTGEVGTTQQCSWSATYQDGAYSTSTSSAPGCTTTEGSYSVDGSQRSLDANWTTIQGTYSITFIDGTVYSPTITINGGYTDAVNCAKDNLGNLTTVKILADTWLPITGRKGYTGYKQWYIGTSETAPDYTQLRTIATARSDFKPYSYRQYIPDDAKYVFVAFPHAWNYKVYTCYDEKIQADISARFVDKGLYSVPGPTEGSEATLYRVYQYYSNGIPLSENWYGYTFDSRD